MQTRKPKITPDYETIDDVAFKEKRRSKALGLADYSTIDDIMTIELETQIPNPVPGTEIPNPAPEMGLKIPDAETATESLDWMPMYSVVNKKKPLVRDESLEVRPFASDDENAIGNMLHNLQQCIDDLDSTPPPIPPRTSGMTELKEKKTAVEEILEAAGLPVESSPGGGGVQTTTRLVFTPSGPIANPNLMDAGTQGLALSLSRCGADRKKIHPYDTVDIPGLDDADAMRGSDV